MFIHAVNGRLIRDFTTPPTYISPVEVIPRLWLRMSTCWFVNGIVVAGIVGALYMPVAFGLVVTHALVAINAMTKNARNMKH